MKKSNQVKSLEEAIYKTLKSYGYDELPERATYLIYIIVAHIDRMDKYEDAILCFTENDGAQEYIRTKGKQALLEEMNALISTESKNIDLYQEYSKYCYTRLCNQNKGEKQKVKVK